MSVYVRMIGLPEDVQALVEAISRAAGVRITSTSRDYPSRQDARQVRRYVDVELREPVPSRSGEVGE